MPNRLDEIIAVLEGDLVPLSTRRRDVRVTAPPTDYRTEAAPARFRSTHRLLMVRPKSRSPRYQDMRPAICSAGPARSWMAHRAGGALYRHKERAPGISNPARAHDATAPQHIGGARELKNRPPGWHGDIGQERGRALCFPRASPGGDLLTPCTGSWLGTCHPWRRRSANSDGAGRCGRGWTCRGQEGNGLSWGSRLRSGVKFRGVDKVRDCRFVLIVTRTV